MKIKKNTYVLLDDGTKLYVTKGTNKEGGMIEGWNVDKHWSMACFTSRVTKIL